MKLVIVITSEVTNGLDIANAWEAAGAPGVTILPAHGLQSLKQAAREGEIEIPRMRRSFGNVIAGVLRNIAPRCELVLSVVEDDMVEALVARSREFLNLDEPNQGILFVLEVERAIGVRNPDEA
jgi:nitrogen regulatory protein PII